MGQHYALESFWEGYGNLPKEVQVQADKNFALLKATPDHPSLYFKKVGFLYSVRIGLSYRALARPKDEDFYWFWIGSHSEYDLQLKKG